MPQPHSTRPRLQRVSPERLVELLDNAIKALMSLPEDESSSRAVSPREEAIRLVEDLLERTGLSYEGQMALMESIVQKCREERQGNA